MLRDDATVVARLRALRRRLRHGPHQTSSTRARLPTATAPWLRGLACVARSFRSSRAPESQPCRCCPFYGSQGCPSLACAAGLVQGGSCARVLVISWPLGPRLPPQLAFYYDAKFVLRLKTDLIFAIDHTPREDVSETQETVREPFCSSSFLHRERTKDKRT